MSWRVAWLTPASWKKPCITPSCRWQGGALLLESQGSDEGEVATSTVTSKDNPRRIAMPLLHIGHDGLRGCLCVIVGRRIGVFRG